MYKDYCDLCGIEIHLETDMLKLEITRRGTNKPACSPVEMCPHCKQEVLEELNRMRQRPMSCCSSMRAKVSEVQPTNDPA